jgi:hypothetical protein
VSSHFDFGIGPTKAMTISVKQSWGMGIERQKPAGAWADDLLLLRPYNIPTTRGTPTGAGDEEGDLRPVINAIE